MKNIFLSLTFIGLLFLPVVLVAQFPNLRSASDFVLFTTTGAVGNTGVSEVMGKIGTNNGAITDFTPIPGQQENANIITGQASTDLQTAYDEIFLASPTYSPHAAILGNGETLLPGVYIIPEAASIVGILILDAQGNPNAKFIIKILGAFSPGPSSEIQLIGGALSCNVYWAVDGGAIAIATLAQMKGTFIANPGAVSLAATGQLEGRLLSTTGAITVDGVIANLPMCTTVLPVTLLSFNASWVNASIELSWRVENEISFSGYEIQRSDDGLHFFTIGVLPSAQSFSSRTYQWIDQLPTSTSNLYRLKMINMDNSFTYSRIVKMDMASGKSILVYPNPVLNHSMSLHMSNQQAGVYELDLFDLQGKKMMNRKLIQSQHTTVNIIALDTKIPGGIYFLQITNPLKNKRTIRIFIQ